MTRFWTYYIGASFRRMPDANGRRWLTAVIWYPKGRKRLGYLYPSIRWF
jgi:hypothetical protein